MIVTLVSSILNDPLYLSKFQFIYNSLSKPHLSIINPTNIYTELKSCDKEKIYEIILGLVKGSDIVINIIDGISSDEINKIIEYAKSNNIVTKSIYFSYNPLNINFCVDKSKDIVYDSITNTIYYNLTAPNKYILIKQLENILLQISNDSNYKNLYKYYIPYKLYGIIL